MTGKSVDAESVIQNFTTYSLWLYDKRETIFFEEPTDSLLPETFNRAIITIPIV